MNARSIVLFAIVTACGGFVVADETQSDYVARINKANEALRNNEFDKAIAEYDSAQLDAGESYPDYADELQYNKAIALYRKGDVAAAEKLFSSVASSPNDRLAAKARFNAGNCHYAAAMQVRDRDRETAMEQLESAITDFRSAVSIDTEDNDARANIELAVKLLDQLRQEAEQEQQQQQQQPNQIQQQQDQQQQEQSEQQQSNSGESEQDEQSQDSEDQSNDKQSEENEESNESNEGKDSGQQSEQQQSGDDESQDQNQESGEESQQSESAQQKDQSRTQQDAESEGGQEEASQASEQMDDAKETPKGELEAANDEMEQTEGQPLGEAIAADGEMTDEEARKMLQAIRDRDMLRRLRRQAAERARRIPVDKDW